MPASHGRSLSPSRNQSRGGSRSPSRESLSPSRARASDLKISLSLDLIPPRPKFVNTDAHHPLGIPDPNDWMNVEITPFPPTARGLTAADMNFKPDPFFTRGWAYGSIFYGFEEADAEAERQRRKNKVARGSSYFDRVKHWREVQESRAFRPPNAFYELLRKDRLMAEDADRQERIDRAARMFLMHIQGALRAHYMAWKEKVEKNKMVRKLMMRQMFGIQRTVLVEWHSYTKKMKRAKHLMSRHMADAQTKAYIAWKDYVVKNNKVKHFLQKHMGKLEETSFHKWRNHVRVKKFLLQKIGKHLVGATREKFMRWHKFSTTSLKIKRLVAKHFVGAVRMCYAAWYDWTGKSLRAKRMFAKGLVGLQKTVFHLWRGVTTQLAIERRERELWAKHKKPDDFFSIEQWGVPNHDVKPFKRNHVGVRCKWRVY
jgi:hypothetical protein